MQTPDPGIYPDVPFEEYKQWDAMNASTLVEGLQSMRRLKSKLDKRLPDKDSDTLRFGRAVHCRLLEPDEYATRFQQPERGIHPLKPKKKGDPPKQCSAYGRYMTSEGWMCGTHAPEDAYQPEDFVTHEQAARVEKIREYALTDPTLGKLHRYKGSEACVVSELCGVKVKCRIDKLIQAKGTIKIVDLKTVSPGPLSKPGAEDAFARDRVKFNYHVKLAFYADAVEKLTGISPKSFWGVLESDEPFEVACVEMHEPERELGRLLYQGVLDKVRVAQEAGKFPGAYEGGPMFSELPQWYWKQFKYDTMPKEIR